MSWRNTSAYRNWKKSCIERENGVCQVTKATKNLHVHHINHASYFPDQRFDVDNGFVIHRSVHYLFHYLMMGSTRKKCTKKDLDRFLRLFKFVRLISKIINN